MIPNFLRSFVGNCDDKEVEGYLCSLLDKLLDKSKWRIVEHCDYLLPSFGTFEKSLSCFILLNKHLMHVTCEFTWGEFNLLNVVKFLKSLMGGNIQGFQFYHLHFKD